ITEVVPLENYLDIYGSIGSSKSIASILRYAEKTELPKHTIALKNESFAGSKGVVGIIGAGNFTKMTMLPAMKGTGAGLKYIASQGGLSGTTMAQKHGFSHSTTDYKEILNDSEVDLVMITTRHNQHAPMVIERSTSESFKISL